MEAMPTLAAFAAAYEAGAAQVVWTRLVADLETPVSAYLKLAADKPMSFLLESVEGGAARGRYSVIGLEPDLVWRADGDQAFINRTPVAKPDAFTREPQPTLASLRALLADSQIALPAELPPMAAGIFGYMGYDTVRLMERLPDDAARRAAHPRRHPDAPDGDGDLRHHQGRDHHRLAGAPGRQSAGGKGLQGRLQAPEGRRRRAQRAAAALAGGHRRARSPRPSRRPTRRPPNTRRWCSGPRSTSSPATSSRSSSRSASRRRSRCRHSRSTAPCAAPTPRRSSSISTSAASPSSARARRSWCACAKAR